MWSRRLKIWLLVLLLLCHRVQPGSCPATLVGVGARHEQSFDQVALQVPRGGWTIIPAGWNPFGFKMTKLGEEFLAFGGSRESDLGLFLVSIKSRKRWSTIKAQWLEVVRASKKGQMMRVYRELERILDFCLKAGFVN